jgi:hypothetical protein
LQASTSTTSKRDDGKMLSEALTAAYPQPVQSDDVTVELIQRSPEGETRELIQCDKSMNLKDPTEDRKIRPGDEVVLPATCPTPQGLQRPPATPVADAH